MFNSGMLNSPLIADDNDEEDRALINPPPSGSIWDIIEDEGL